ncbi:vacuolar sorting protein [Collybia nuda]|uniref:Vacuolar sorting protein n=1 Tax=Collybia nuda TaxID=64659 RepID=A0A9P6CL06_9AGAR|nr:vacuolar sorting protein [Collybia nuda]
MTLEAEEVIGQPSQLYHRRAKEFLELHDQVQTSVNLLDSLESFLSTFQKDLSAVSGQISELQDRSKDIDNRLKSRRRIEKPLSNLISDITLPPQLATLILDTDVGEPWILAITDFERRLETTKARSRVKAARDLGEVIEGLRIVVATKLRAFFLALFQPIRRNVTTNMQVIQTSVLLKYSCLFGFLQRQAPSVAHEIQRSYVGAARVYYETGFRRYARSLGWIKARSAEKHETIVVSEREKDLQVDPERLEHSKIEGPGVTLAYMADDKGHKEPIEALLRSLLLVFMDNATAEYTFVKTFFSAKETLPAEDSNNALLSPTLLLSPDRGDFFDQRSILGSDYDGQRNTQPTNTIGAIEPSVDVTRKENQATLDAIWKQIMDPVLVYCEAFIKTTLDPIPPVISLLTMIRLMEDVVLEVQKRNCPPVEFFVFGLRLQMWPVFQKAMAENIDALKKLAEGTGSGYFSRAAIITNHSVTNICGRYTVVFNSFINLTEQEEETMIFSNLLRMRQELSKLILRHTNNIGDVVTKATAQSTIYELLLQGLSKGIYSSAHPKSQQEIAYWANLEEEARRKIASAGRSQPRS